MHECLHCDIHPLLEKALKRDSVPRIIYNLMQCTAEIIASNTRGADMQKAVTYGAQVLRIEVNSAIEEFTKAGRYNGNPVPPISEDSPAIAAIKQAIEREPPAMDESYKAGYRAALRSVLADVFAAEGGELSRGDR